MFKKKLLLLFTACAILVIGVSSCHERVSGKKKCKKDFRKVDKLKKNSNMAPGFK